MLSVLLDIYLGSEITASYGNLCLTFWDNAKLFSTAVVSFYFLTSSGRGLNLSTYSSVFVIFSLLKKPREYEVVSCFDLHFPNDKWCSLFVFMYLLAICVSYLKKLLFKSFTHLKIGLFVFLLQSCKSSLYILDMRSLSGWQIFSPIL